MKVITTHYNADFDALSSMVAAKKLYPDALLVFPRRVPAAHVVELAAGAAQREGGVRRAHASDRAVERHHEHARP